MRTTISQYTLIAWFLGLGKVDAYVPGLYHKNHSPINKNTKYRNNFYFPKDSRYVTILGFSKNDEIDITEKVSDVNRNEPSKDIEDIVVLGGGFGGLNTALYLASLPWEDDNNASPPRIKLVDRKERFVFLPLLYELCVGDAEIEEVAPTFQSLLKDVPIDFIQADVQGVDAKNNMVYLKSSRTEPSQDTCTQISYDSLVIATGIQSDLSVVPGASQFALPFYTVEDCYELRKRLTLLDKSIIHDDGVLQAVVVGGGYSGVELALNLMERLGGESNAQVTLVHRGNTILEGASEFSRNTSISRLEKAGVKILTNMSVDKIDSCDDSYEDHEKYVQISKKYDSIVHLSSSNSNESIETQTLFSNVVLWTAGAKPPPNKGTLNSIFPRDKNNRIVTDNRLLVKDSNNVFCIGDASRGKKNPYPATAQVAMQQAPVAAWNIFSTLRNKKAENDLKTLLPFRFLDLGIMMTLGSDDASISSLGGLVQIEGPVAGVLRRLIYTARMPTTDQAVTAAVSSSLNKISKNTSKRISEKGRKK